MEELNVLLKQSIMVRLLNLSSLPPSVMQVIFEIMYLKPSATAIYFVNEFGHWKIPVLLLLMIVVKIAL